MPLLRLQTSAPPPAEEKARALLQSLSSTLARVLGKPESYVMTCLAPVSEMTFAGSFEPSCLVEVKSIGNLTRENATALSEAVCKQVHETLGVAENRIFLVCTDVPAHLWGFDSKTFG
jgi:phenylpyruvate tautomerase PptA (4-oxalocrotonate tautomerase family)